MDPCIRLIDSGNPKSNRIGLEAAIATANTGPGVRPVIVPHGFIIDRPVLAFGEDLEIQGDRPKARLIANGAFPPLVIGLDPKPGPQDGVLPPPRRPWTGDHVKDSFGVLDATVAPAPGSWYGVSTFGSDNLPDTIYALPNSPFSNPGGKSWSDLPSATIDLAYVAADPDVLGPMVIGASEAPHPRPVWVQTEAGPRGPSHLCYFETIDPAGAVQKRWCRVDIPEVGTALRRLSLFIDPANAAIRAYAGGNQVAVDMGGIGPGWAPGLKFVDANLSPFKLGGGGPTIDAWTDGFGVPVRYTYHGFRIAEGNPYADDGPGTPQAQADTGAATTDAARYWYRPNMVGLLRTDAEFAFHIKESRFLPWATQRPNSTLGYGLALLGGNHTHPFNTGTKLRLVDLALLGGSAEDANFRPYGAAIWAGGTLQGFRFERCSFLGGMDGFGGLIAGACYPVLFRDCTFRGGSGNGMTGNMMTVHFDGLTMVQNPARNGMIFLRSGVTISSIFMGECGPKCLTNISLLFGGRLAMRDFTFDTENTPSPTVAVILAERGVNGDSPGTVLVLDDGVIDGGAEGVPLILLRDVSAQPLFPAFVSLCGVLCWHPERGPGIRTDGPMWKGDVKGLLGNEEFTREHTGEFGDPGAISGLP